MNFADAYSRCCYSADHAGLPSMLAAIPIPSWQGRPTADHTARLVASDYLRDLGRDGEADLLKDTAKHAYLEDGEVKDADDLGKEWESALPRPGRSRLTSSVGGDERQHLDTALWSSTNRDGLPLDENHTAYDIEPATVGHMLADWRHFRSEHAADLGDDPDDRAPHDFWLSRNGHGAGFFAMPEYYGDAQAKRLQKAAQKHGEFHLDTTADDDVDDPEVEDGSDGHGSVYGYYG